jgi:hypothetical protein
MICASVQRPMPVALSGVMFAASAVNLFASKSLPPARVFLAMDRQALLAAGRPRGLRVRIRR